MPIKKHVSFSFLFLNVFFISFPVVFFMIPGWCRKDNHGSNKLFNTLLINLSCVLSSKVSMPIFYLLAKGLLLLLFLWNCYHQVNAKTFITKVWLETSLFNNFDMPGYFKNFMGNAVKMFMMGTCIVPQQDKHPLWHWHPSSEPQLESSLLSFWSISC